MYLLQGIRTQAKGRDGSKIKATGDGGVDPAILSIMRENRQGLFKALEARDMLLGEV